MTTGGAKSGEKIGSGYNLLTSLVLIIPLFLIYQIGVLLTWPIHNGADMITSLMVSRLNLVGYIALNLAIALVICVAAAAQKKKEGIQAGLIVPLLLESTLYAFFLGSVIVFLLVKVMHLPVPERLAMDGAMGPLDKFVMSAGAGVHEEILFRLVILGGLAAIFKGMKFTPVQAFLGALLISSTLFSAVHHIGELGDDFTVFVFMFRLLAGAIFGVLYWFRGLAVAVYTHAIYDMFVLLF